MRGASTGIPIHLCHPSRPHSSVSPDRSCSSLEREYQRTSLFCTRKTHRPPSSHSGEAGPVGATGSLAEGKGRELQKGCGRDPGDGEAVWREEMAVRSPRGPQTLTNAEGRRHIHLVAPIPSPGRGSPREGSQEEGRPCTLSVLQGRGQHSRPRASTSRPPAPLTPKSAGRGAGRAFEDAGHPAPRGTHVPLRPTPAPSALPLLQATRPSVLPARPALLGPNVSHGESLPGRGFLASQAEQRRVQEGHPRPHQASCLQAEGEASPRWRVCCSGQETLSGLA